ncbi:MAG: peptidyl-prolyl cis-trans isomerase [Bryobacteraceae bacterium]
MKGGADFAELAKKNSEDPGSAANGGDLGWIQRGQTVPEFEKAAFTLAPKDLSGIIKTQYGFHIVQVLEKQEARLRPFEEVKGQIEAELRRQAGRDNLDRLMDQAHEAIAHDPPHAEQIAQSLQIQFVKMDKVSARQPIPGLGASPDLQEAIGSAQKGGVTPVVALPGDKLALAVVTEIHPARPAELSEVQDQIKSRIESIKIGQILETRAKDAMEKTLASGGDLKKVAQQFGAEVKTTQEFTRNGAADGIGPANFLAKGFEQPPGGVFGPVTISGKRFICRVQERIPADMSKLPAETEALRTGLRNDKAQQREEIFSDSIVNALTRDKKIKRHDDVIKSFIANFRG